MLIALAHQSVRSHRRPSGDRGCRSEAMMEIVLALAIGVLAGSGVWLLLRPRTFQVIIGLSLLSYAVNLFIFAMGRLRTGAAPIVPAGRAARSRRSYADPAAAGAGADGHRDQLRDDRAAARRAARRARPDRHRPRRRTGARTSDRLADHLVIAPMVLPLVAGARCCCSSASGAAASRPALNAGVAARAACGRRRAGATRRRQRLSPAVYRLGDWPAPFGIVLVVDRLAALMVLLDHAARAGRAVVLARALAPRRAALPSAVSVPADGRQRRLPHRRPVQPVRFLRGACSRLRTASRCTARARRACRRACTTSSSTSRRRCCS